jgi:hypothetical protein
MDRPSAAATAQLLTILRSLEVKRLQAHALVRPRQATSWFLVGGGRATPILRVLEILLGGRPVRRISNGRYLDAD